MFTDDNGVKQLPYKEWDGHMSWCPSQLYHKHKGYIFYMRWRWDDPWTLSLLNESEDFLVDNLNEKYQLYYRDDNWKSMIDRIEEIKDTIINDYENSLKEVI